MPIRVFIETNCLKASIFELDINFKIEKKTDQKNFNVDTS